MMPRPVSRGGNRGWSLAQVAAQAQLSRGVVRAAQAKGFFGNPLTDIDILVARVSHACLQFPNPDTQVGALGHRDRLAIHLTRSLQSRPTVSDSMVLALSRGTAELLQLQPPPHPHYPPSTDIWRLWEKDADGPPTATTPWALGHARQPLSPQSPL